MTQESPREPGVTAFRREVSPSFRAIPGAWRAKPWAPLVADVSELLAHPARGMKQAATYLSLHQPEGSSDR